MTSSDLWVPADEDDLRAAASGGALTESHYLDLKAALDDGDKANRGLAIDLASFAVDGGLILIGVDGRTNPPVLAPVQLTGLKERLDQVARSRVDQPLRITVREIQAAVVSDLGYLAIVIPPSPVAPHMVAGVYRGRSDTTNTALSDAEVRRIHDERRRGERDIRDLLRAEIDRDPVHADRRAQAHLLLACQPVYAQPDMLQRILGDTWLDWMTSVLRDPPHLTEFWDPAFNHAATRVYQRADGWAGTTLLPDRTLRDGGTDARLLDVEVHEDGGIRLLASATDSGDSRSRLLIDPLVPGLTWHTLWLAGQIAQKAKYLGNWNVGLALTGLRGVVSHFLVMSTVDPMRYPEDVYEALALATYADVTADPTPVVERLCGRLNRALTRGQYRLPTRRPNDRTPTT